MSSGSAEQAARGITAGRRKRVLVVSQHYWPEHFRVTDIAEGLAALGIDVDVLCGLPNYPDGVLYKGYGYFRPRKQQRNGVTVYRAGEVPRRGNSNLKIFLNYVSFPVTALLKLPRLLGRRHDAVFCFQTSPVLMALPAIVHAKLRRVPLSMYVLDLWPENLYTVLRVKSAFWRRVAFSVSRWHYRKADRLIGMSAPLGDRLREIAGKDGPEVFCVPHYCEGFYENQARDEALDARFAGTFNVVVAGNISPAQGLEILVPAAQKVLREGVGDVRFVIVGDGMSRGRLQAAVSEAGLEKWFSFEGQKLPEEVPAYQAMADVLLAAQVRCEDFGLTVPGKVTSYIAAGKPILASMDGAGAALINEAGCGLTSQTGDASALADNLIRLYRMAPEERARYGENALDYHRRYLKRELLLRKFAEIILKEDRAR